MRAGCRRLVIVSSHGGNSALMDLVALGLRGRHGMVAVTTAWSRFGTPPGLFPDDEVRHGIHGGGIETALMLALRPDLVRTRAVRDFVPASRAMEETYTHLRAAARPPSPGMPRISTRPAPSGMPASGLRRPAAPSSITAPAPSWTCCAT